MGIDSPGDAVVRQELGFWNLFEGEGRKNLYLQFPPSLLWLFPPPDWSKGREER